MVGCEFKGRYLGACFGHRVAECDFSTVKVLDLCSFASGADVASCTFPGWPHVVINEPASHRETLISLDVGEELALTLDVVSELPETTACTVHVPTYETPSEDLRRLFERLTFVRC